MSNAFVAHCGLALSACNPENHLGAHYSRVKLTKMENRRSILWSMLDGMLTRLGNQAKIRPETGDSSPRFAINKNFSVDASTDTN